MEAFLANREDAGNRLSAKLLQYRNTDSIILAVPRGGVPIGFHIAKNLGLPLDIILSKKIGHPVNSEYAIGSVTPDEVIIDHHPEVSAAYLQKETERIRKSLAERYKMFRGDKKPADVSGKNVLLIDDGIATGNTILATVNMLRKKNPAKIIVVTPVLPFSVIPRLSDAADELVYLEAPYYFTGVSAFYEDFTQVEDEEVIRLLHEADKWAKIA